MNGCSIFAHLCCSTHAMAAPLPAIFPALTPFPALSTAPLAFPFHDYLSSPPTMQMAPSMGFYNPYLMTNTFPMFPYTPLNSFPVIPAAWNPFGAATQADEQFQAPRNVPRSDLSVAQSLLTLKNPFLSSVEVHDTTRHLAPLVCKSSSSPNLPVSPRAAHSIVATELPTGSIAILQVRSDFIFGLQLQPQPLMCEMVIDMHCLQEPCSVQLNSKIGKSYMVRPTIKVGSPT